MISGQKVMILLNFGHVPLFRIVVMSVTHFCALTFMTNKIINFWNAPSKFHLFLWQIRPRPAHFLDGHFFNCEKIRILDFLDVPFKNNKFDLRQIKVPFLICHMSLHRNVSLTLQLVGPKKGCNENTTKTFFILMSGNPSIIIFSMAPV